jgi:hypothetical protein
MKKGLRIESVCMYVPIISWTSHVSALSVEIRQVWNVDFKQEQAFALWLYKAWKF